MKGSMKHTKETICEWCGQVKNCWLCDDGDEDGTKIYLCSQCYAESTDQQEE